MNQSLEIQLAIHIAYRAVFNAPVKIADLKVWMGVDEENLEHFENSIAKFKGKGLIEEKDGYLVSRGKGIAIEEQPAKDRMTEQLIGRGHKFLMWFSKIPFVRFIGISGSLASNNPTIDANGLNEGKIDMDLFVISAKNTLWILFLIERIVTNFHKLIFRHNFYCFNYVTDESFLTIHNKNFYTATELVNMKRVYGDQAYHQFISENLWFRNYYSNELSEGKHKKLRTSFVLELMAPLNYLCFVLFALGRALKRMDIRPLFETGYKFNPKNKTNLRRIANSNGGYQEAIKKSFDGVFKEDFPDHYSEEIMDELFPKPSAFNFTTENVYDYEIGELFKKYA